MIDLNHIELTTFPTPIPDESTLLRYWQAEIPDTGLFAVTEEGFTRLDREGEPQKYVQMTRFFVCGSPANNHGPAGNVIRQDETYSYGNGPIGPAITALTEPTSWADAPRQAMLVEAIESVTQDA